jgi:hypothetical protein
MNEKLQKQMTYNENGEGVINGKTIRELETESMKKLVENQQYKMFDSILKKKLKKRFRKNRHRYRENNVAQFLKNNIEIILGVGISFLFYFIFNIFKTNDESSNASLLSGLIGGVGAIVAILLSISFSKRSNEQTMDSSVLPYIIVKRVNEVPITYVSFEYFSDEEKLFYGWRQFEFETIKDDKRTLVRNGVTYLHLENIGLGPAKKMKIEIENFGTLLLDKDYLKPNESMDIILNFSNPDKDKKANLTIKYETIRNISHTQKFKANITWHLDRTNFTLFS